MLFLDHTLPAIEENLALDEALLPERESGARSEEVLRLWDAKIPFIVLGRSSRLDTEVHRSVANDANVPILRRISGGATILAAPGCMFYSVILSLVDRPHLRMLDTAHSFVMRKLLDAVGALEPNAKLDGTCDIVLGGKKVSGNSLRVQRNWMLYHGTLLWDMDVSLISRYLKHPPREPDYRDGRMHRDFVANLGVARSELQERLRTTWDASTEYGSIDRESIRELVDAKYSQAAWNHLR